MTVVTNSISKSPPSLCAISATKFGNHQAILILDAAIWWALEPLRESGSHDILLLPTLCHFSIFLWMINLGRLYLDHLFMWSSYCIILHFVVSMTYRCLPNLLSMYIFSITFLLAHSIQCLGKFWFQIQTFVILINETLAFSKHFFFGITLFYFLVPFMFHRFVDV